LREIAPFAANGLLKFEEAIAADPLGGNPCHFSQQCRAIAPLSSEPLRLLTGFL
jgi:hypothetical protein